MNTTENNKLIAEFLGYSQPHPSYPNTTYWYKEGREPLTILLFHTDWNWLMQVVEKIESLSYSRGRKYYLFMEQSYVQIRIDRMNYKPFGKWGTSSNKDKLKAVYRACVEFIELYNKNKN